MYIDEIFPPALRTPFLPRLIPWDFPLRLTEQPPRLRVRKSVTPRRPLLSQRQINFTKQTVVDLISQIMVYGQQNHKTKKYDTTRPIKYKGSKCRVM